MEDMFTQKNILPPTRDAGPVPAPAAAAAGAATGAVDLPSLGPVPDLVHAEIAASVRAVTPRQYHLKRLEEHAPPVHPLFSDPEAKAVIRCGQVRDVQNLTHRMCTKCRKCLGFAQTLNEFPPVAVCVKCSMGPVFALDDFVEMDPRVAKHLKERDRLRCICALVERFNAEISRMTPGDHEDIPTLDGYNSSVSLQVLLLSATRLGAQQQSTGDMLRHGAEQGSSDTRQDSFVSLF